MRVNRASILRLLELVRPGIAVRELVEQSSCLVFHEGKVITFNDEIACVVDFPVPIEGAVKAKPVLDLLQKLDDDEVEIEGAGSELKIKGRMRKASFTMESNVMLPIESIDRPTEWFATSLELEDALRVVTPCASKEESQFTLTCVHIHPAYLEACDRFQMARYRTEIGVKNEMLVRAESLQQVVGLGVKEVAESPAWLHFRNKDGLVISFRRYIEEYVKLDHFLETENMSPVSLPGGIDKIVGRAEIFSGENALGNNVLVDLTKNRIVIKGEGVIGWYKEMQKVEYDGPPFRFLIQPQLLIEVSKKAKSCGVLGDRLMVQADRFSYLTCTTVPDDKEKDEDYQMSSVEKQQQGAVESTDDIPF